MDRDQLEKRIFDLEHDLAMGYDEGDAHERAFVKRKIKEYKRKLKLLENNELAFEESFE